jgi:hypothetical protein
MARRQQRNYHLGNLLSILVAERTDPEHVAPTSSAGLLVCTNAEASSANSAIVTRTTDGSVSRALNDYAADGASRE